jgi:hypothetical protein
MNLIPAELRPQLLANGNHPDHDHVPLVKLFDASGPSAWLISEIQPYDHDVLFGLFDFGFGVPQASPFSVTELKNLICFGIRVERDPLFVGRYPLSVYAEAADAQGAITTIPTLLDAAAARLAQRKNGDAS